MARNTDSGALARLRSLQQAAAGDPWTLERLPRENETEQGNRNAEFVAALSPVVVGKLLDAVEAAQAVAEFGSKTFLPPADCTGACDFSSCDCSGEWKEEGPFAALRSALDALDEGTE